MSDKRKLIIESAMIEFSEYGYEESSINRICVTNDLTKGQLYHYFKSKDELYLACVQRVYEFIENYHREHGETKNSIEENLTQYMKVRGNLIERYPLYTTILFRTLVRNPDHLNDEIQSIRRSFKDFNRSLFEKYMSTEILQKNVSISDAINYYFMVLETFNMSLDIQDPDFLEHYHVQTQKILRMMLYGTLERDDEK